MDVGLGKFDRIDGRSAVVTMGISFAVISLAGAAVACQPSSHHCRSVQRQICIPARAADSASS